MAHRGASWRTVVHRTLLAYRALAHDFWNPVLKSECAKTRVHMMTLEYKFKSRTGMEARSAGVPAGFGLEAPQQSSVVNHKSSFSVIGPLSALGRDRGEVFEIPQIINHRS